jgi:RHS repeat-associated protein
MFTGREYDAETGLYYYRARYYSPALGRFLQRDPVGYTAGINLYTYCANNPINFMDPRGLDKEKPWWEKLWEWYLYESVLPGPWGQPMSEWGPYGPTAWGDPLKYTEAAGGWCMWAERLALGLSAISALIAPALAYGLSAGWSSVLYSGPGANIAAAASSGIPIFETKIGSFLNWFSNSVVELPQVVWDATSAIYASEARGTVQVFLTEGVKLTDTFFRVEAPIVEALGKAEMAFR